MIEKMTLVDQIELQRTGDIGVRLVLLIVEDGVILSQKYHRTMIAAGASASGQMGLVNAHLAAMGEQPVQASDLDRIVALATTDAAQPGRKETAKALRSRP